MERLVVWGSFCHAWLLIPSLIATTMKAFIRARGPPEQESPLPVSEHELEKGGGPQEAVAMRRGKALLVQHR